MQILGVLGRVHLVAEGGDEPGYTHPVLASGAGDGTGIDLNLHRRALDGLGADLGDDALRGLRTGQCAFHQQHCADRGSVRKQPPGLARREQMRVKRAVEYACCHVSFPARFAPKWLWPA